jgi:hypothetical protein
VFFIHAYAFPCFRFHRTLSGRAGVFPFDLLVNKIKKCS